MIYNNPLDHKMEQFSGQTVDASTLLQYFDYDPVVTEDLLENWVKKHRDDCQVLGRNPLRVKIFLTPHDIKVYNKNIHNKNMARWKR